MCALGLDDPGSNPRLTKVRNFGIFFLGKFMIQFNVTLSGVVESVTKRVTGCLKIFKICHICSMRQKGFSKNMENMGLFLCIPHFPCQIEQNKFCLRMTKILKWTANCSVCDHVMPKIGIRNVHTV